jgi:hypothetical protein
MGARFEGWCLQIIDLNQSIFANFSSPLVTVKKLYGKTSVSRKVAVHFEVTFRSMVALRYRPRSTILVRCDPGERFASDVVLSVRSAAHPARAL